MESKLKIELVQLPSIEKVSDFIGEELLETIGEIFDLHKKLEELVDEYGSMSKDRIEAANAADEYLRSNLHGITAARNRVFVVRGIEAEMQSVIEQGAHILAVLKTALAPIYKTNE